MKSILFCVMRNKNYLNLLLCLSFTTTYCYGQSGRVGIGVATPRAGLDVQHNDGIVSEGTYGSGNTDNIPSSEGSRLLWIPKKAAFAVGYASYASGVLQNIGDFSISLGSGNITSGKSSLAFGANNTASGEKAVAMGLSNFATGSSSLALGVGCDASGVRGVAIGDNALAQNLRSFAIGFNVTASGINSLSTGSQTVASGNFSTAMGYNVSTAGKTGAFVIGDAYPLQMTESSAPNKFTARFANGYLLYTSDDHSSFVAVGTGGNAWISSSDSTRKTNFIAADGESFLKKLSSLRLGSWNYKKQDVHTMRHYGPMAQEFFTAFGKDNLGTIGNDTTLNTADVDGVAFVLLKALEKRTADLTREVNQLKQQLAEVSTVNPNHLRGATAPWERVPETWLDARVVKTQPAAKTSSKH